MAGNFVEVLPDNTGKKVEALQVNSDTDQVFRQVVEWGDHKGVDVVDILKSILIELRESRRVICEATRVNFEELQGEI